MAPAINAYDGRGAVTLVTKCIASYNQRRLNNTVLVVYTAVRDVLPAVHY